jgi:hypothetical protein
MRLYDFFILCLLFLLIFLIIIACPKVVISDFCKMHPTDPECLRYPVNKTEFERRKIK